MTHIIITVTQLSAANHHHKTLPTPDHLLSCHHKILSDHVPLCNLVVGERHKKKVNQQQQQKQTTNKTNKM